MDLEQQAILQVVAAIPAGKVSSYGRIAERAGLTGKARYVGYILRQLPKDSSLPWHRVVNASGKISLPPDSPSFERQKARLADEGVVILNGKINLKQHLW